MTIRFPAIALVAALAACSPDLPDKAEPAGNDATMTGTGEYDGVQNTADTASAPAAPADPAATARTEADYLGKWVGVEGMFLNVSKRDGGGVTLEMQWDLDNRGTFPGSVTAEGLRFTRNGKDEIAVPGDGNATGLKWLAGEKNCLTVRTGEGYCRA